MITKPDALERIARAVRDEPRPLPLRGGIQPYAWGGFEFLRELSGLDLAPDVPAAEWWVGAHPLMPSWVMLDDLACPLDALIERVPEAILGHAVAARFGRLPFLLKVLDVRQMLSIQAHPTLQQAREGFARENAQGLPLDAPTRTYRDDNHKPEGQVALSPFWMLFGFRHLRDMSEVLRARPEVASLADRLDALLDRSAATASAGDRVRALYEQVMLLPQPDVDALVGPLVARLAPLYRDGRLDRSSPDFWAARAAEQFGLPGGHVDRGILSIYLLNLVHLAPGEGTYFEAGLPHAYLEGIAVEIMANSDNVIRGGLTPKHVDVPELLRILSFEPATPHPLVGEPAGPAEHRYATPAAEFGLSRLDLGPATEAGCEASGPEALIVIDGTPQLRWRRGRLPLARGGAVLVPAGVSYTLTSPGPACLFRAFVPPASRG